jgi:hypothetical protein
MRVFALEPLISLDFFIFCTVGSTEWDGKKNISPLTGSRIPSFW